MTSMGKCQTIQRQHHLNMMLEIGVLRKFGELGGEMQGGNGPHGGKWGKEGPYLSH